MITLLIVIGTIIYPEIVVNEYNYIRMLTIFSIMLMLSIVIIIIMKIIDGHC